MNATVMQANSNWPFPISIAANGAVTNAVPFGGKHIPPSGASWERALSADEVATVAQWAKTNLTPAVAACWHEYPPAAPAAGRIITPRVCKHCWQPEF